jgi:hypothetical protein
MFNFKIVLLVSAIAAIFVTLFLNVTPAQADIQSVSVTPLVDDSDQPDRFTITGKPGSTQKLKMSITNFGMETLDLRAQPTNATTNSAGQIDFGDLVSSGEFGLKYPFSEMTKAQDFVLKKNQTKELTFTVHLPSQKMDGSVIGGFKVFDVKHPKNGHSGVGVYFDTVANTSKQSLSLHGITPEVHNTQPYLMVDLANYQAKTLKNTVVQVKLKKNNWYNKLGINNQIDVADVNLDKIAPNSRIPIEFNQKQSPIQPGNYLVEGTVKNASKVWHFKENIKVEPVAANMVNQEAKNLIYDKTSLYVAIIGILSAVIVLVFWGIAYQRRFE